MLREGTTFEQEVRDIMKKWYNASHPEDMRNSIIVSRIKLLIKKADDDYKVIPGWTHEDPALVWSFTDVPLYFRDDYVGDIEEVTDSIDYFEGKHGEFVVHKDKYEEAYRQIEEYDNE